jgi:hypothetical protein
LRESAKYWSWPLSVKDQASGFDSNVLETIVRRHIRELQAIAASLEKHAA